MLHSSALCPKSAVVQKACLRIWLTSLSWPWHRPTLWLGMNYEIISLTICFDGDPIQSFTFRSLTRMGPTIVYMQTVKTFHFPGMNNFLFDLDSDDLLADDKTHSLRPEQNGRHFAVIFWNWFFGSKLYLLWSKCHASLFLSMLRVQVMIRQRWFYMYSSFCVKQRHITFNRYT